MIRNQKPLLAGLLLEPPICSLHQCSEAELGWEGLSKVARVKPPNAPNMRTRMFTPAPTASHQHTLRHSAHREPERERARAPESQRAREPERERETQ